MAQSSIAPGGAIFTETFAAPNMSGVFAKMDVRKDELAAQGHTGFHRREVGRNALCPCGSRIKFKKCCLSRAK